MTLVASFVALVQQLCPVMTVPSFLNWLVVVTGWVWARRHTVSWCLVAAGMAGQQHHSAFYRLLSAARWSLDCMGLLLADLILTAFGGCGCVLLTLDDTLAHKRGLKLFGAGMHHDPLISSKKTKLVSWGHSWVILAVVVRLPCLPQRVFSLKVLFRLYLNHKASTRWRQVHHSRPELAVQLLQLLCGHFCTLQLHLLCDSTYGGQSALKYLPVNCQMTSRMALDAHLNEPPPERVPGQRGRPRTLGDRLPWPKQMLEQRAQRVRLNIYGRRDKVRIVSTVARWHTVPKRELKVVAVEPLTGGREQQAFYSTDTGLQAVPLLEQYAQRWSVEEAIQGSKSHLGLEQPQGWSRLAVLRTAPLAMLLYSLIVLWFGRVGYRSYRPLVRPWYWQKRGPSFADMLTTLRRESLREQFSHTLGLERGPPKLPKSLELLAELAA